MALRRRATERVVASVVVADLGVRRKAGVRPQAGRARAATARSRAHRSCCARVVPDARLTPSEPSPGLRPALLRARRSTPCWDSHLSFGASDRGRDASAPRARIPRPSAAVDGTRRRDEGPHRSATLATSHGFRPAGDFQTRRHLSGLEQAEAIAVDGDRKPLRRRAVVEEGNAPSNSRPISPTKPSIVPEPPHATSTGGPTGVRWLDLAARSGPPATAALGTFPPLPRASSSIEIPARSPNGVVSPKSAASSSAGSSSSSAALVDEGQHHARSGTPSSRFRSSGRGMPMTSPISLDVRLAAEPVHHDASLCLRPSRASGRPRTWRGTSAGCDGFRRGAGSAFAPSSVQLAPPFSWMRTCV